MRELQLWLWFIFAGVTVLAYVCSNISRRLEETNKSLAKLAEKVEELVEESQE